MEIQPDLSICLAADNRSFVLAFLRSLHATTPNILFETIIVVAEGFGAREISEEFPHAIIYENTAVESPAASLNRALQLGRGRYLSLWEQDVAFQNSCLRKLVDFLDVTPETGIAGPRISNPHGGPLLSARGFPGLLQLLRFTMGLGPPFAGGDTLFFPTGREGLKSLAMDWLLASALVIRQETLEDIGLLNPSLPGQYWALDYCLRARKAGWHIHYIPTAEVVKPGLADLRPSWPCALRYLLKKILIR